MSYKTSSKLQWFALFGIGLGYSLIYLDVTALSIALPDIQTQLSASNIQLFWIINSYTLGVATTSLAGGRFGDIVGLRKVFLTGIVLFGLSSIAGALSFTPTFLIVSRVFQGIGGAITLATSVTIIYHIFPPEKQGKATGIFGLGAIFFVLVGPFIGGLFTQYSTWRWIFWINPMIGIPAFLIIYYILKGIDDDRDHEASFDYIGQLLLMGTLVPLILGLMEGQSWGWASPIIIGLFALSIIFFVAFIYSQKKVKHPLFDLSLFSKLNFKIAMLIFIVLQFPLASSMYNALYLEISLGLSPLMAGLALLPPGIFSFISNPIAGKLVDRWGYRPILRIGLIGAVMAYLWITFTAMQQRYIFLLITLILVNLTMPLVFVSCFVMIMRTTPKKQRGMVSGMSITMRQAGGSLCVALMGVVTSWVHNHYESSLPKGILYAKSFTISMILVGVAVTIGALISFFIDRDKKSLSSDPTLL